MRHTSPSETRGAQSRRVRRLCFLASAILVSAGCVIVLLSPGVRSIGNPLQARLVQIEPSGMLDDFGLESNLVDVEVLNRGLRLIATSEEQQDVDVKVRDTWIKVKNLWRLNSLHPDRKRPFLL